MRLPPYGKAIQEVFDQGLVPHDLIWIIVDFHKYAFNIAKNTQPFSMALCLWEDPFNYHWPVKDCDVLVLYWLPFNDEYIEKLIIKLDDAGARNIYTYCVPSHLPNHFIRS